MNITTKDAFQALKSAINTDDSYAWAWHCNIAMASIDQGFDHYSANLAAARFMKNCFDADVNKYSPEKIKGGE